MGKRKKRSPRGSDQGKLGEGSINGTDLSEIVDSGIEGGLKK